jgi:polyhydroxyalkanoate synthesis repressor PhaR
MRFTRTPPRLIKKYPNRRLYDTADSAYITLDELAQRVRAGVDVRIVDATTGDDLTQQTLTQWLFDGRGAARFLSVPLLTQLIRLGDDALSEFLGRYVAAALELYVQSRRGAQALAPFNPLAGLPFAAAEALARMFSPWSATPPMPSGPYGWAPPVGYAVTPTPAFQTAELRDPRGYSPAELDPSHDTHPELSAADPTPDREGITEREGSTGREIAALRRELDALRAQVRGTDAARDEGELPKKRSRASPPSGRKKA